jgi:hypothetical protein
MLSTKTSSKEPYEQRHTKDDEQNSTIDAMAYRRAGHKSYDDTEHSADNHSNHSADYVLASVDGWHRRCNERDISHGRVS